MKLQGVFTAIITPFNNGEVDVATLRALVDRQIAAKVSGIVPVGTTGESPTLTAKEQQTVLETVVDQVRGRVLVIGGCGSNSTAKAIEATRIAKSVGVDVSLQVTPYYNKPNQEGLYRHFCAIADAVDLPMVLYNIPGRSAVNISVVTMLRLFAHSNIIAVKEASNDISQIMDLISQLPDGCVVLSGEDSFAYSIISLGGVGVVSVAANLIPEQMVDLAQSAFRGQYEQARRTHYRLLPFFRACFFDTNPIPIKYMLAQKGLTNAEWRLPLTAPSPEIASRIDSVLQRLL